MNASLVLVTLIALSGCASRPAMESPSLYERLGGRTALEAVVDDFIANVGADDRINGYFIMSDPARFRSKLLEQLCAAAGGPCTYTGEDMETVHAGRGIEDSDFDAMLEDLRKSLNTFEVPAREQDELLALITPMRDAIVEQ